MDHIKVLLTCAVCGKQFYRWPCEIKKNKSGIFYCSRECRNVGWTGEGNPNYGNNWSDEQKHALSEKKRGTPAWNKGLTKYDHPGVMKYANALIGNEFYKNIKHRNPNNPALFTTENNPMNDPEIRKKVGKKLKGKLAGDKNPNWRGGLSFGEYCPKFNGSLKEDIRDKYNRKCAICGKRESDCNKKLAIHHTDYNKNTLCNGKSWGLIPLCANCHAKTNGNRWYWFGLLYNYWCYKYQDMEGLSCQLVTLT